MSQYFLPHHVHFCVSSDSAVFLDIAQDKYFGLPPAETKALRSMIDAVGPPVAESEAVASVLACQRLLTQDPEAGRELIPTTVPAPRTLLVDVDSGCRRPIRTRDVVQLVAAYCSARFSLNARSLEYAVRRISVRKSRHGTRCSLDESRELMRVFDYLRPLLYAKRQECLLDSIVLVEFFARYGLFPTLIFGVTSRPFEAHAWVQFGDVVFNDRPARVSRFQPILAV